MIDCAFWNHLAVLIRTLYFFYELDSQVKQKGEAAFLPSNPKKYDPEFCGITTSTLIWDPSGAVDLALWTCLANPPHSVGNYPLRNLLEDLLWNKRWKGYLFLEYTCLTPGSRMRNNRFQSKYNHSKLKMSLWSARRELLTATDSSMWPQWRQTLGFRCRSWGSMF